MHDAQLTIENLVHWQNEFLVKLKPNTKIENVRQLGTIVAFDVKTNATSNYFNNLRDFLYDNFIERGVLLRPLGNTIYILPPYIITKTQLQNVYDVIDEVLEIL
jgi:adenosylmethionine-8-amino-7-oxononanoate aminotransferase